MKKTILFLGALAFLSCEKEDPDGHDHDHDHGGSTSDTVATYMVTVNIDWNSTDHPTDYPNNPHFSPIIYWNQDANYGKFDIGNMASQGVQIMAETGAPSTLLNELEMDSISGMVGNYDSGSMLNSGTGQIQFTIEVHKDLPVISAVTMLAPSPDWFLAMKSGSLHDGTSFTGHSEFTLPLYDAGTDSGTTYNSANSPTVPQEAISEFGSAPFSNDGTSVDPPLASVVVHKM